MQLGPYAQFGGCTWWVGNQLVTRSVFPENAETLAICMAYDYLGVNNAVRNGHHVMLAPMNFSRGMDWKPFEGLNRYIREVKQIQDRLQETVFLGEVMGREGVKLRGVPARGIDYNVFRNRRTGLVGCILTNSYLESQQQVIEALGKSAFARVHVPGRPSYNVKWPAAIDIPGERIVFLEELAAKPAVIKNSKPLTPKQSKRLTSIPNGDFELGKFEGWTADPNWVIANDSRGHYAGWQGGHWAWSGGIGEAAVGKLTSKPFRLDRSGVRLLISGWDSIQGSGSPRRWNYVTLNLADGTEIDRVYAPNTTNFVPVYLDGSKHKGKMAYIEAVDDADQPTYSMLCIDDVHTADLPPEYNQPAPSFPKSDPKKSIRLEDENILVEVSRSNGSIIRIHDKKTGLDLIVEPRLAENWKFSLPLPGNEPWQTIEANWIIGRNQKLTSFEHLGKELILRWDGPLTNYLGEKYDVSVETRIKLTQGGVIFDEAIIKNRTPYAVGETYYPILGGIQGLGKTRGELKRTRMFRPLASGDSAAVADIFRIFANMSSFGDQGPEQFYRHPEEGPPIVHFESSRLGRSVCLFSHNPLKRHLVTHLELVPSSSGTIREDGNWPRPEELRGMPVGVKLSFVDCAGSQPAQDYTTSPLFVRFHDGDWRDS
ncbi:MAG: hypothetical protein N3B12_07175, partial [Armatimonadetes bacterium]|nr:hypothetical protein [Armatimonadota bacterium]